MKEAGFDARVVAALNVTVFLWASSYSAIRVGLTLSGPARWPSRACPLIQKPYLEKYGALVFTTYAIWVRTLLSLLFLLGLGVQAGTAPAGTLLSMLYLGVFPTALGYVTYAFSRMPASRAVSFLCLIPVMDYLIAWPCLGEVPAPLSVVGGGGALLGVAIVNTPGRRR